MNGFQIFLKKFKASVSPYQNLIVTGNLLINVIFQHLFNYEVILGILFFFQPATTTILATVNKLLTSNAFSKSLNVFYYKFTEDQRGKKNLPQLPSDIQFNRKNLQFKV